MVKNNPKSVAQGGYSELWLWPCYLVVSGLTLYLTPHIGLIVSLALVSTPALYAAKKFGAKIQRSNYDIDAWMKDLEYAVDNNLPAPDLADYETLTKKQPTPKLKHNPLQKTLSATH